MKQHAVNEVSIIVGMGQFKISLRVQSIPTQNVSWNTKCLTEYHLYPSVHSSNSALTCQPGDTYLNWTKREFQQNYGINSTLKGLLIFVTACITEQLNQNHWTPSKEIWKDCVMVKSDGSVCRKLMLQLIPILRPSRFCEASSGKWHIIIRNLWHATPCISKSLTPTLNPGTLEINGCYWQQQCPGLFLTML